MNRRLASSLLRLVGGIALGGALPFALPLAQATDLSEVYQQALRNDPQLREAEALRLAALEAKPQALSALLPQVSAGGSYSRDQTNGSQVVFDGQAFTTRSSESDLNSKGWGITLRQNLFRWDNWAALKQADASVAQAEADYRTAQQALVLRTAQAYFNVLAARDTLTAAESALEAIARQLEQAEKRFEVGLIAITDVQEAKAAHDQATATVIAGKRALATRLEELRELTGEPVTELKAPGDEMPLAAPSPASEEQWVRQALEQNLALTAARLSADVAREAIGVARGGHGPSLDLVARKSSSSTNGDTATITTLGTLNNPIDTNSDADSISLQFSIPLYSGGATQSRVRQAVYRHR
ncbi:MAG: TolC family outer membrane protein, partial [Gammaproteobacteria bacterium]